MVSVLDDQARTCAAPGCGKSMEGRRWNAEYCDDACRARAWKAKQAGNGQNGSETPEQRRLRHDREYHARRRSVGVIPSDVRVSFDKAVDVLAAKLARDGIGWTEDGPTQSREVAWLWLRDALPERLRELV